MEQDRPDPFEDEEPPGGEPPAGEPPKWEVDPNASRFRLAHEVERLDPHGADGGAMVYVDETGRRRRLPPDMGELSRAEVAAAADALSRQLGAQPRNPAIVAALERLSELHASGKMSDEDYDRERRRLIDYGS